jgi:hypothetical protein
MKAKLSKIRILAYILLHLSIATFREAISAAGRKLCRK